MRILLPLLIFLGITLAVAFPRIGLPYGWDDGTSFRVVHATIPVQTNVYDMLKQQASAVWYDSGNPASAYRPLNSLIVIAEVFLFGTDTLIPDFIQTALLGATAVIIYFLATSLSGRRIIGLGASFFFSFSIPTLGFTWVLLNKQPAVSLAIVLGLLGYLRYLNTGKWKWLCILWVSCLIGPLLRELTVILPLTALFETLVERRKNPLLLISLPLLTIYGFFPSFLPNLILYGRAVFQLTLNRGIAGAQLGATGAGLGGLHFEMPYVLLLFTPYVLTILGALSITLFIAHTKRIGRKASLLLSLGFVLVSFVTLVMYPILVPGYTPNYANIWIILPSIFVLTIVTLSFSFNRLLSIWFLVSFLPFYKIYTEDVHLAPASIPWIIMILLWISRLPTFGSPRASKIFTSGVKNRGRLWRFVRVSLIAVMILGIAQQGSNLQAVSSTFGGMTREVQTMSNLLTSMAPRGALVIVNFPQGGLIAFYTGGEIQNQVALGGFVWPFTNEVLADQRALLAADHYLLNQSVFLVTQTSPSSPTPSYDGLFDGLKRNITILKLDVKYPLIDPLEGLLPHDYAQFPGPSDLQAYMVLINSPWYREYISTYTVFEFVPCKGTACNIPQFPGSPTPTLVVQGYQGYNIVSYDGAYYAILQSEGAFVIGKITSHAYSSCFFGSSVVAVEQLISVDASKPQSRCLGQ